MAQEHVNKQEKAPQEDVEEVEAKDLKDEELDQDVEDMLADIDDALGDLTEEETFAFVDQYRQQGGQ